ncbi:hypothetical protein [Pollutimonas thiosulfatoxidans]|uniref:hypothetical protein n=1 Tax=Pollutimonas thiosulfatoxidans TaxID=2028345 RepID=UPI0013E3E1A3|nr:hypothetical protein [Pollutimonas thiosulfatoxidans]NYT46266.1 hypothetical protein [Alcaligenaceae bacterium]
MMEILGQKAPVIVALIALLIAILWIALPFAVFGIKSRLDRIIQLLEQQRSEK